MAVELKTAPTGVRSMSGVIHKRSPFSVAETVLRLTAAIRNAGNTPFFVVDHSGEAHRAGTELRDTKLVGFGDPALNATIIAAAPLAALDLPLRVLVWRDDNETVWMTYLDPTWWAKRHRLAPELVEPLTALEQLTTQAANTES
ncbi:DUF302 domain-containing protein [Kribbella swartbergensis]